jgi:hypothetical protein
MTYDEARSSLPVDIYNQLTIPIATLEELPASLQEAICAARSMPVAEAADFIEHFVRSNYVYSFEAANSHVYQGFQKDRAAEVVHEENAYLKMIHALGDDKCLGKGVCGQLSTVLFASLRLAGVPCFMTSGYLAAEQEIDENMGHAYVSAVLRTTDGRWRFKILEATGGGVEGLIALQKRELQRLQSIQKSGPHEETALEQSARRHMESNKWSWLVAEFGDSIANLTDHDADIFYVQVMSCRGLEPNPDPSAADVADAYGALIGSSEDLVSRLDPVFIQYPRIQRIFEIAKERRTEIIKKIEAQLFDDFEVGGADTTLPRL